MAPIQNSRLRQSLSDSAEFTLTFELVPGRGGRTQEINRIVNLAKEIAADGRFQAFSITENAGGQPALSPETLGTEIMAMGSEVIIHLSCKDKNRNQMESLLFGWDRHNMHNLLVIAGDFPKEGYCGFPKPVFDLDTIHALDMLRGMNNMKIETLPSEDSATGHITPFLKGVVVSPFKMLESELMMQYYKLHRKVAAGADFVITQLGYDARKFHELLLYMKENDLNLPVLGNVFIPSLKVADLMHKGKLPGCIIPDSLYEQMHWEARTEDMGKRARLTRAAKLLAVLKGLGYDGAHIGGPALSFKDLDFILNEAEQMAPDWQNLIADLSFYPPKAFYYYDKDHATGLNTPVISKRSKNKSFHLPNYVFSQWIHEAAFEPAGFLHSPAKKVCLRLDESRLKNTLTMIEHMIKAAIFGCHNCGDCTLEELAFLCPQSRCAKYLLNGPCGGSINGWCEVYPGRKRCLYVMVYERFKSRGLEEELKKGFIPPRNWSLDNTSSWVNYYRGRGHFSKQKNCSP
ncbi:MAG: methylenetetrahydrofolate reductase C-terminal domain-containing protein [Proteobacteria bacterium]|nr:methylenetetrahydrofolate reductase C-terminal domain-containing protein [Pseudomonadota bacterium]